MVLLNQTMEYLLDLVRWLSTSFDLGFELFLFSSQFMVGGVSGRTLDVLEPVIVQPGHVIVPVQTPPLVGKVEIAADHPRKCSSASQTTATVRRSNNEWRCMANSRQLFTVPLLLDTCDYEQWSAWSPCSVTCEDGTQTRTRGLTNNITKEESNNCDLVETRSCSALQRHCPTSKPKMCIQLSLILCSVSACQRVITGREHQVNENGCVTVYKRPIYTCAGPCANGEECCKRSRRRRMRWVVHCPGDNFWQEARFDIIRECECTTRRCPRTWEQLKETLEHKLKAKKRLVQKLPANQIHAQSLNYCDYCMYTIIIS